MIHEAHAQLKKVWQSIRPRRGKLPQPVQPPVLEPLESRILLTLLGVTPEFPQITYDTTGTTAYDATTDSFDISATPNFFRELAGFPLRAVTGTASFTININRTIIWHFHDFNIP